jgi:hypothetical protein
MRKMQFIDQALQVLANNRGPTSDLDLTCSRSIARRTSRRLLGDLAMLAMCPKQQPPHCGL